MRVLKTVLFVIVFGMVSCTKTDTLETDELYENAIRKDEIKDQDVG